MKKEKYAKRPNYDVRNTADHLKRKGGNVCEISEEG